LIGQNNELLPQERSRVIYRFLQELLDTIIDFSSYYKFKFNQKEAKAENEYMKESVILPFQSKEVLVEKESGINERKTLYHFFINK
jgi:hypothetical protein